MALCAQAERAELDGALREVGYGGAADDLRGPEVGLVMVRGRMGGDGRPFNFGEATVARAAVRLESGETGFAYQLGRDLAKARAAALLDALMQSPRRAAVERALEPIAGRLAAERTVRGRQSAATRVNFFTLVRGEDE
jgi:alpha-D-ribose 1-methylphosphonate 5-triphosphate synthase subunit PhnG